MRVVDSHFSFFVLLVALPLVLAACHTGGDTETIFVERPLFDEPLGFLGYDEMGDKFTVCGNCHVGQQATWEQTAHANA